MERFMLICLVLLILGVISRVLISKVGEIETFDNLLGGVLDLRPGSLGATNGKTASSWIPAASFTMSTANQEVDVVLEVYGPGRQTFLITVQNDGSKATTTRFMHMNHFGTSGIVFNAAMLTISGSGLNTTNKLFLQMANDNTQNVPIVWYLKGVGINDSFAVSNVDIVAPPSGGQSSQVLDSAAGVSAQINALSASITTLQNQVNSLTNTANNANSNAQTAVNRINQGPTNCRWLSTAMNDAGNGNANYIDRHTPGDGCADGEVLKKLHMNRNGQANQYRFDYMCCRT